MNDSNKPDLKLISDHIDALKRDEPKWHPYGDGNPYYYCEDCKQSNVKGHKKSCRFYELSRLIHNLELLLDLSKNPK